MQQFGGPVVVMVAGFVLMALGFGDILSGLLLSRRRARATTTGYLILASGVVSLALGIGLVLVGIFKR